MSSNFLCKICHKIRKEPIFLPCNCTSICREHTLFLYETKRPHSITCQECHKTFDIPPEGFRENKMMRNLIESNAFLNDEEKKLKLNIITNIKKLKEICLDLETKLNQFSLKQSDHFYNLNKKRNFYFSKNLFYFY